MNKIDQVLGSPPPRSFSNVRVGDTVEVHYRIKEGEKERIQIFKGIVIRFKKGGLNSSLTVRKVSYGIGVERIYPLHSPLIDDIKIISRGRVRRAKLYYIRSLKGKRAMRLKDTVAFRQ